MRKGTIKTLATVALVTVMTLGTAMAPVQHMNAFGGTVAYAAELKEEAVKVFVDGKAITFEGQQPIVKDGRTLVPVKGVFTQLSWTVSWDAKVNATILTKGNVTLFVPVDKDRIMIKETGKADRLSNQLDVPSQVLNGSMMLPMQTIAEVTGTTGTWDSAKRTATFTTTASTTAVVGGIVEFKPDRYDITIGQGKEYHAGKYGINFTNQSHFYAWQWSQYSPAQQEEAERIYTSNPNSFDGFSDAQISMYQSYKYKDYLTPSQQVKSVATKPTADGVYAAVHELVTPVTRTCEVNAQFGSGKMVKIQRPVFEDGFANITSWLTEKQVSEKLEALKSKYPNGTQWGEANAKGCDDFATEITTALFGQVAYHGYYGEKHKDLSQIRPGDVISFGTDGPLGSHIAVVYKVENGVISLAEGNVVSAYGAGDGKVMWGLTVTTAELEKAGYTVYTFYSPIYNPGK